MANDPVSGSPAYKKAYRRHLKSTRNRQHENESSWTTFRTSEKKYMSRFPPPDLSDVLDLAVLDKERKDEINAGIWRGRQDALVTREIKLKPLASTEQKHKRAFCVPRIPGLILLPGYLSPQAQRELVRWSLADQARYPNQTNLDAHYSIPREGVWNMHLRSHSSNHDLETCFIHPKTSNSTGTPHGPVSSDTTACSSSNCSPASNQHQPRSMASTNCSMATASELVPKLRWTNIGWFYDWGTKKYDFGRGKIEVTAPVRLLCKEIVRSISWRDVFSDSMLRSTEESNRDEPRADVKYWESNYEPDAGIINFYHHKDNLMAHVDRSEVCATSPLVSLSLGNAAVFLIGGLTLEEKPVAILLRSGDAVVMAGPVCRRAYHGVPRIIENTLPVYLHKTEGSSADWTIYGRYLESTRINVNVRQVFPKGFDPAD